MFSNAVWSRLIRAISDKIEELDIGAFLSTGNRVMEEGTVRQDTGFHSFMETFACALAEGQVIYISIWANCDSEWNTHSGVVVSAGLNDHDSAWVPSYNEDWILKYELEEATTVSSLMDALKLCSYEEHDTQTLISMGR